ncbi:MAG: c-type cytochrome [Nitrospinae bacterium]|nr:c-type cytochrome [Nitrospinota bacterium]
MKIKVKLLFAVILAIPLYLTFLALQTDIAQAIDEHEADHKLMESSPEHETYEVKVPESKLAEVKALKNAVASNNNTLSEAKAVYGGKGTCFNCHGEKGKGDGELASSFDPRPRNFTMPAWQKLRTDGEIFYVITNGTDHGMPGFGDMLSDEEKWSLVNYIRDFGKHSGLASKK